EQREDGARVEPARERAGDRHVGETPARDGVAQTAPQTGDPVGTGRRPVGREPEPVPPPGGELTGVQVDFDQMAGREPLDSGQDRPPAWDEAETQVMPQRVDVEIAPDPGNAEQRGQLRSESEAASAWTGVIERLDAEAVPGGDEPPANTVDDREREHAVQLRQ